jgi:hypothetical protein
MDFEPGNCIFSKITLCAEGCFDLLKEVWGHIPVSEKIVICNQLGMINFAYFNNLSEVHQRDLNITPTEGGATTEFDGKCSVRIDMSRSLENIKLSIAHELAHVIFNHPIKKTDYSIAEDEAKNKAREWGYTHEE